jgi:hypothetical protein
MKERETRDLVQYPGGDVTNPAPVPRDDDGHPDVHVQRALISLEHALDEWANRQGPTLQAEGPRGDGSFGAKLARRGYVLVLVTKETDGAVFRSTTEHEFPLGDARVAMGSQS